MSAFGRRSGSGGAAGGRPLSASAQPMKGPGVPQPRPADEGGAQFPPIEPEALDVEERSHFSRRRTTPTRWRGSPTARRSPASRPLRASEGFEASIHRIKEQVLPRLLERVDPEAAATLSKDELAEEFRPIIGEVLAELKINLNRREQFALEKVLVDELLGLGPLEELLNDPDDQRHHGQRPEPDLHRAQGQARDRPDPVPRRGASAPDRPAHRQQGRPPRRPDHAARRRPPPGRQPRQRHHPAALAARHRHLDS